MISAVGNSNILSRRAKCAGLGLLVWSLVADHVTSKTVSWLPDAIKISITRSNGSFILDLAASRYSHPSHPTLLYNATSVVARRLLLLRVSSGWQLTSCSSTGYAFAKRLLMILKSMGYLLPPAISAVGHLTYNRVIGELMYCHENRRSELSALRRNTLLLSYRTSVSKGDV